MPNADAVTSPTKHTMTTTDAASPPTPAKAAASERADAAAILANERAARLAALRRDAAARFGMAAPLRVSKLALRARAATACAPGFPAPGFPASVPTALKLAIRFVPLGAVRTLRFGLAGRSFVRPSAFLCAPRLILLTASSFALRPALVAAFVVPWAVATAADSTRDSAHMLAPCLSSGVRAGLAMLLISSFASRPAALSARVAGIRLLRVFTSLATVRVLMVLSKVASFLRAVCGWWCRYSPGLVVMSL